MFAYPYRCYEAVWIEWGGRCERRQGRVGRCIGGVFGRDESSWRKADVFLDEDHLEGLVSVWCPYRRTELGVEDITETRDEENKRVLILWGRRRVVLCATETGDEHDGRELGQQLGGIRVHRDQCDLVVGKIISTPWLTSWSTSFDSLLITRRRHDHTRRLHMPEQLRVCSTARPLPPTSDRAQRLRPVWDRMHLSQGKV